MLPHHRAEVRLLEPRLRVADNWYVGVDPLPHPGEARPDRDFLLLLSWYVIFPHRQQHTIGRSVSVSGFGYWSGQDINIAFHPAEVDSGIRFIRVDQNPPGSVIAHVRNRVETPRRTNLDANGNSAEMVEHLLAALAGLYVDNCEIHIDAAEIAGFDGSSLPFATALLDAKIVPQDALRPQLIVKEVTRVGSDSSWVEARPATGQAFSVKYRLDYGSESAIGRQSLELDVTPDSFLRELAPARTFVLDDEAQWLRERGMGLRVTTEDLLVFNDQGLINNTLRFEDECVRHKALDLIGDLSLAGCDLIGHFVAYKSGHRLNSELTAALLAEGQIEEGYRLSA